MIDGSECPDCGGYVATDDCTGYECTECGRPFDVSDLLLP